MGLNQCLTVPERWISCALFILELLKVITRWLLKLHIIKTPINTLDFIRFFHSLKWKDDIQQTYRTRILLGFYFFQRIWLNTTFEKFCFIFQIFILFLELSFDFGEISISELKTKINRVKTIQWYRIDETKVGGELDLGLCKCQKIPSINDIWENNYNSKFWCEICHCFDAELHVFDRVSSTEKWYNTQSNRFGQLQMDFNNFCACAAFPFALKNINRIALH